jgi:hypothetical protein
VEFVIGRKVVQEVNVKRFIPTGWTHIWKETVEKKTKLLLWYM